MKRTPEQEAARRERQARTAAHPKCFCGNVAAFGQAMCGLHLREHEERAEEARQRHYLLDLIDEAETVDDLKGVLRDIVGRLG